MEAIKNEFRHQALQQPDFKDVTHERVPEFDFTLPEIPLDSPFAAGSQFNAQADDVKVTYQKPANYD